jgi:hypothetical protein
MRFLPSVARVCAILGALAASAGWSRPASACGGCFSVTVSSRPTVVDAHRMAFAISPQQTVLWDQIRYSGDPAEFAWVLPVRSGARVELSRDEFFAALDASTQPVINYTVAGGNPGCMLAGCGSSNSAAGGGGGTSVQVLSQQVVGPYETVTLRSTDPNALANWLAAHQFDLPAAVQPVLDQYVSEGFDFIALRLRPQCGEQSMQPVRVVTPGADPTLPLRMVAAGVGPQVGITLFVLGQGRWRPQNFAEALFDDSQLTWDFATSSSNYETLAETLMAGNGGRTFLTEAAMQPDLYSWVPSHPEQSGGTPYGYYGGSYYGGNPGLASSYFAFCRQSSTVPGTASPVTVPVPCGADAGPDAESDAGPEGASSPEAGDDAGQEAGAADVAEASTDAAEASVDAAEDAETADAMDGGSLDDASDALPPVEGGDAPVTVTADAAAADASDAGARVDSGIAVITTQPPPLPDPCQGFDDLDMAFGNAPVSTVWVTRLRANLPASALAVDLQLEASPVQEPVPTVHRVPVQPVVTQRQGCVSVTHSKDALSTVILVIGTLMGISGIRRRHRR